MTGYFTETFSKSDLKLSKRYTLYEGEFIDGVRSGPGTLFYNDELIVKGIFDDDNRCKNIKVTTKSNGKVIFKAADVSVSSPLDHDELVLEYDENYYVYLPDGHLYFIGNIEYQHTSRLNQEANDNSRIHELKIIYVNGRMFDGTLTYEGEYRDNIIYNGYIYRDNVKVVEVIAGVHHRVGVALATPGGGAEPPPGYTESAPPSYSVAERGVAPDYKTATF